MRFVDISGFGNSGKTVVTDFLRQYNSIFSFPNHVEFELFRVPGGLLDLYFSIYESWNLIRSTVCIDEFKYLVNRIGTIQTINNPISYFTASGHGYNQYFNNRFIELSNELINKIIIGEQYTYWPYKNLRVNPLAVFFNKFKSKFFNELISDKIYFSNRTHFIEYLEEYMQKLFAEATSNIHTHVLLNNAFDPFNPSLCINMIGDACAIVVDRDPRDIYASQINDSDKFIPEFEKKKNIERIKRQIIAFDDIDQFILKYKTIKSNIKDTDENKVLRIRYEDFLLDHQNQAQLVKKFIRLNEDVTISKTDFNINNSLKNIGLWKRYRDLPEIKTIYKELKPYCYQSQSDYNNL
jgi:hypothetical protein